MCSTPECPSSGSKVPKGDEARLIIAAAEGRKLEEIASAAGISVSSAKRRTECVEIKRKIEAAKDLRLDHLMARHLEAALLGADELARIIRDADVPTPAKLKAIEINSGVVLRLTNSLHLRRRYDDLAELIGVEPHES